MPARGNKKRFALWGFVLLAVAAVAVVGSGACKKKSRDVGYEAREAYESSKKMLKEGFDKTKDATKEGLEKGGEVAKEGLDKSKEAAKEFSKGWKDAGERRRD